MIVNGSVLASMLKLPLASVVDELVVPFRTILTPSIGESWSSFTTPCKRFWPYEVEKISKKNRLAIVFINVFLSF